MELGFFSPPYAQAYVDGKRTLQEVIEWDLQVARWADEYGLDEIFFAEHHTIGHEPNPAPDLMIAAAARETTRLKLGAAAHLLPYHNPIALATRLMYLDHMTGGRYIAGFAPGSFPTDAQLFNIELGNPKRFDEAVDVITSIWTRQGPFRLEGEFWTVDMPAHSDQWNGPHLKPFQNPHPEVMMTGVQPTSPTFVEAGRRGFSPMSQQVGMAALLQQWDTYERAAVEAGHTPDRSNWRVMRDVFVADTDAEARKLFLEGPAGRTWEDLVLPTFRAVRDRGGKKYALGELLLDPGMTIDELTLEWMVDNFFIIGSPDTVVDKITKFNDELGGVGALLSFTFDYSQDPEPYRRHLELLGREVRPRIADLGPRGAAE
ncbi:LLM class flavin-dependent oxidoreductase [Arthrobacter sp. YN]|uniref:LLM class flavin-dependent oxidoreductase n=1 Tax=Arthrobacter sp. YN TaxID=2020486 RepID=UPI000B5F1F3C|nr:LLM class flavin-dependent oxidoreductase [Arthrobacter sp. YN]ASN20006.1 LLM class flavin-dependent oxidoreductase [Arthrobacter sp. YN]